jgi:hypothetical protein
VATPQNFPPADAGHHNYTEMANETATVASNFPALVQRFSVGNSYQGRALWATKISDNVATGEYDIATGSYRSWRKNRQPNSDSSAVGTDLNRNWSYQWGLLWRIEREPVVLDLPGTVGVLRPGDPAGAQLRAGPGGRRAAADPRRDRLPHLLRADPVAVRLHLQRHRAGPDR